MKKRKILLTGGCSFSECISTHIDTWPRHLEKNLPTYEHISTGMGSQGNGLISRRIIYNLTQLIKKINSENILVGIMWSGPNRHDFYSSQDYVLDKDTGMENPTRFVKDATGSWTIINQCWRNELSLQYYGNFYDHIGSLIYTYEHILRVQWFLKLHNIKYFMTTYTNEVFPTDQITNNNVQHLYEQINFDQFLPVQGEYEWCRDYSGLEFPVKGDNHPSTQQHQRFTKQVILPFLQQKDYV